MKSYLANRSQSVKLRNVTSNLITLTDGVTQGSILVSLLLSKPIYPILKPKN